MKPLKPSMKENKRYLKISYSAGAGKEDVEKAILEFGGVLGMSKTGLSWIKPDVLCVNREAVDLVRASIAVYEKKIEVRKVSGTLKSLRK